MDTEQISVDIYHIFLKIVLYHLEIHESFSTVSLGEKGMRMRAKLCPLKILLHKYTIQYPHVLLDSF